ncbi:hypothetical protein CBL_10044, partial [Carabus blaptoides fortunei]
MLQNLIANAFDDIEYEDENSTDNSIYDETQRNSSRYKSYEQNDSTGNMNDYKESSLNGTDQLRVLYEVRVREINSLSKQLDEVKSELKLERETAQRKILLLEADCEKTRLSLKQSQNLLVENKRSLDDKNEEIFQLKESIVNINSSKEKGEEEIRYWKSTTDELQQRIHMIEKGINTQVSEKQIRSRYENEIDDLQNALCVCNKKLEKKDQDYRILQNDLKEANNAREMVMSDKAQVINSMTSSLEKAQEQNQLMLSKISDLQIEKQTIQHELLSIKSMMKNKDDTVSNNYHEMISTLQNELKRTLEEQSHKRNEIMRLENIIKEFRDNKTQDDITKKNYEMRDNVNKQVVEDLSKRNNNILEENSDLKDTITQLEKEIKELKNNRLLEENSHEKSSSDYNEECDRLKRELNILHEQMIEHKFWKERYTLCEEQCLKLQDTLAQLNTKLFDAQMTINTLKEKLALKEERDSLIEILKTKAAMFEDYMANKPTPVTTQDKNVCTETIDEPEATENNKDLQSIILSAENNAFEKVKHVFGSKLLELEKMLEAQNIQFTVLSEENKNLKEKIMFDRSAFSELSDMWTNESKKLNVAIKSLVFKNSELTEAVHKLTTRNKEAELTYKTMNSKLTDANNYINVLKVSNKRHEEHLLSEYNRVTKKFQHVLETIQKRV